MTAADAVTLRAAQPADAPALAQLARATWTAAFAASLPAADAQAHVAAFLSDERVARWLVEDTVLLAEAEGQLVGYAQFGDLPAADDQPPGSGELRRLYVQPAFQNQGIGARLLAAALAHPRLGGAPWVYLDVWEHNHRAQQFYARHGFERVGERRFVTASGAAGDLDFILRRPGGRHAGCGVCGELRAEEYGFQKYGWPADDSYLPAAADRLRLVKDLAPHGGRTRHLQQCPACGTYYLYRTDYEFLAGGSEDEQFLTRLTEAEAAAYLTA